MFVRVGLAVLVVSVSGKYLYERLTLSVSVDGVVSAPLTPVRAPIDGQVSLTENVRPGGAIQKGIELFSVVDDRVDERTLTELKLKLSSLSDELELLDGKLASLEALKKDLLLRVAYHREATVARLEAMIAEANAGLAGARAKALQAENEHLRSDELAKRGFASRARLDEAIAEKARTSAESGRLEALLQKLSVEIESARNGVVLGEGYSDAPYSLQRVDELRVRLVDLRAERTRLANNERELKARIGAEERHIHQLTKGSIVSSASGVLWNVRVGEGSWVSRGEALADLADCTQSFVEATLPERGFESVRPGDAVTVRLLGSSADIAGIIRSVRGSGAAVSGSHRAAGLDQLASGMMTVVVDLKSDFFPAVGCQLGRSAKVYFEGSKEHDPKPSLSSSLQFNSRWDVARSM